MFEDAIDLLETEWFKRFEMSSATTDRSVGLGFDINDSDDVCAACDDGDGSDANQIVSFGLFVFWLECEPLRVTNVFFFLFLFEDLLRWLQFASTSAMLWS